jgi:hypothetical protein
MAVFIRIFDVKISTPTCTPLKNPRHDDIFKNDLSKKGLEYF